VQVPLPEVGARVEQLDAQGRAGGVDLARREQLTGQLPLPFEANNHKQERLPPSLQRMGPLRQGTVHLDQALLHGLEEALTGGLVLLQLGAQPPQLTPGPAPVPAGFTTP
jgi:hypothetical protein